MRIAFVIACAFVLDFLFGDPHWLPHPIRFIGGMINRLEKIIRKRIHHAFAGGALLSFIVITVSYLVPFAILYAAGKINTYLSLGFEILFAYQILAARSLKTESMKVYYPLVQNDLPNARKFLSYIVGRDTQSLEPKSIIKATVETVAENTSDGVVAPLLFLAIGGDPLAFLYKAINTMDSMIGYKNEKYILFGRFAARLDDVANWIPARISAWFMIAASFLLRLDVKNAVKIYLRDRRKHKSPNSAQTESVCAGALNIQLAGDACYFGQLVEKPFIGDDNRDIEARDILLANRLMYLTSFLCAICFAGLRILIWR